MPKEKVKNIKSKIEIKSSTHRNREELKGQKRGRQ
jgi:hypothetical protein